MVNHRQDLLLERYRASDRVMLFVCWGLFVLALGLASWHGTWAAALLIGLPAAVVPSTLVYLSGGSAVTRVALGAAFMVMTALHIHQGHGMLELHFGVFVLLAVLLYYRDWKPIVAAAGVIAVHHLGFDYLQRGGAPVWVFEANTGFHIVLIHAAYVIVESGLLVYLALQLRKEAVEAEEIRAIGAHLKVVDGQVNLAYRHPDARSAFAIGFNQFMDAVANAVSQVAGTAQRLRDATEEMARIAADARGHVDVQSRQTDAAAHSIEEMRHAVEEVARGAANAAEAAQRARDTAQEGMAIVTGTRDKTQELVAHTNEASSLVARLKQEGESIGKVLDVIKGVAEQTNLLALNAAIEAARAGEQGRGFAVVADEVRTLASRTQESTREIEAMIVRLQSGVREAAHAMESSAAAATESADYAQRMSSGLSGIAEAIDNINAMNARIAAAAEEQSAAAGEIAGNVETIRDVAQRTTAGAEGTARASVELDQLARELDASVRQFRT
jgi:methyl-accepting chemotaxis protein